MKKKSKYVLVACAVVGVCNLLLINVFGLEIGLKTKNTNCHKATTFPAPYSCTVCWPNGGGGVTCVTTTYLNAVGTTGAGSCETQSCVGDGPCVSCTDDPTVQPPHCTYSVTTPGCDGPSTDQSNAGTCARKTLVCPP